MNFSDNSKALVLAHASRFAPGDYRMNMVALSGQPGIDRYPCAHALANQTPR